ncbi:hypothetical protein [Halobacillus sp. H74]|uniref:hypothetical protein n=1 Tax=Halobacillus sp. H74 TaxID=3457436 RepID=UPI003FCE4CD2
MKYAISVTDTTMTGHIEKSGLEVLKRLDSYAESLAAITDYEEPRGIVFHDLKSATELYSDIPLPAYTSRDLIHLTPLVDTWKDLFRQSAGDSEKAHIYYDKLDINDIVEIAAHELTHHAEFFHDDFDEIDETNMWFEEGLCFYLPRKIIFSEEKREAIMKVESDLIQQYKDEYGEYSLTKFGQAGYRGGERFEYSAAFYDYWRSTKVVTTLVEKYYNGDVNTLVEAYQKWINEENDIGLHTFFVREQEMSRQEAYQLWLF